MIHTTVTIKIEDAILDVNGKYFERERETREYPEEPARFKVSDIIWDGKDVTDLVFSLRSEDEVEELCLLELEE